MASTHRKLLPKQLDDQNSSTSIIISPPPSIPTVESCLHFFCDPLQNDTVQGFCPTPCLALCPSICKYALPDVLPPPPHPNKSHNISPLLISMLVVLAFMLVIISFYIVYTKIYPHFNTTQTRHGQTRSWRGGLSDDDVNTFDDHGHTVMFHPVWYIPTVGLNPSVINSIKVLTYKRSSSKDGVHVDGSDCAVCLAEFQDGDSLRVLPKCNHAFHIPCIDTWLRSHTNCPLCRAPVVVPDNPTAENSSSVDVASSEGHGDRDCDDDRTVVILRRSSSFDENNIKNNCDKGSSSSRHERGPGYLVGRSFSCTAKIFSSRYNNNNNDDDDDDDDDGDDDGGE